MGWYKLFEFALLCSILGVVVAIFMRSDGETFQLPGGAVHQNEWYYTGGDSHHGGSAVPGWMSDAQSYDPSWMIG